MSRHAVIFEDAAWSRLYPITLSRPTFDCRTGVTTLGRRLAAQLARREFRRVEYLCRPLLRPIVEREYSGHGVNRPTEGDVYFLNGRLLALGESLDDLLGLLDRAGAVQEHAELVGARMSGDRAQAFGRDLLEALEKGEPAPFPIDHTTAPLPANLRLVRHLWDLVALNAQVLEDDFAWMDYPQLHAPPDLAPGAQILHRDRVRSREGVRIEAGAILDATHGPIFLGEGVQVQHHAVVLGPAAVGPRSVVRVGARIEGPVSWGPVCKVGGEVESSILQGYANKQHDGYLGHAYVGAWTNLGALTSNSDLKNNYSTVRVWTPEGTLDTGERFVGVFLGDHAKTAIGTLLNTGTVVGFSANVVSAGFPPKHVPSFTWGGAQGFEPYDLEKAIAAARAVMARRETALEPADEVLFRAVYAGTRPGGLFA
jgi:UDP-N-acetylglucosamine diphosphorylase/glucosamine-1-phosphate N-acetyltransferase